MRTAQLMSTAIYLLFIALATVLFHDGLGADVTAIIGMTKPVAVVLPILLAVAAIGSQFSAAVADNAGAGTDRRHYPSQSSDPLCVFADPSGDGFADLVNERQRDNCHASRAFAIYYTLQCAVAWVVAFQERNLRRRSMRLVMFAFLAVMCLLVFALRIPSG